MNVFEILDYEHQLIGHALQAAQGCARRLAQPGAQMEPLVQELADFSSHFVSECHQVKEFNLFIRLLQKGRSYVIAPITGLHDEHSRGAQLSAALEQAWCCAQEKQAGTCELAAGYLADYVALMQVHLTKEDRFYKVTQPILEAVDHTGLKLLFEKVEEETLGVEGYARYCQWAAQLQA